MRLKILQWALAVGTLAGSLSSGATFVYALSGSWRQVADTGVLALILIAGYHAIDYLWNGDIPMIGGGWSGPGPRSTQ